MTLQNLETCDDAGRGFWLAVVVATDLRLQVLRPALVVEDVDELEERLSLPLHAVRLRRHNTAFWDTLVLPVGWHFYAIKCKQASTVWSWFTYLSNKKCLLSFPALWIEPTGENIQNFQTAICGPSTAIISIGEKGEVSANSVWTSSLN